MKAEIEVLHPGLFSSVQDLGRFGFQKFGVPQSGVMDRYAMRMCNLILGNSLESSVLEITMQGPKLKFLGTTAICISGADLSPTINGELIENNIFIAIQENDILEFGKRKSGFRSYLGISGGFSTETMMGSKSWYEDLTSVFRLQKGVKLEYWSKPFQGSETHSAIKANLDYLLEGHIEVFPGPEFERLDTQQQHEIFISEFSIDENSNRMAVQLRENLQNDLDSIITAPVMPGTVQLTPSGKIIILMRDCQTTGGYPRILQLSEKGIATLSQKLPGEKIFFQKKLYPNFSKK